MAINHVKTSKMHVVKKKKKGRRRSAGVVSLFLSNGEYTTDRNSFSKLALNQYVPESRCRPRLCVYLRVSVMCVFPLANGLPGDPRSAV